jgi:AcrR family transcriptional regulator
MSTTVVRRARSVEAKQQRESDILAAARELGSARGIRAVTLSDIADAVGMHKSALLRYFETREQIFLRLTADGWREWGRSVRESLAALADASSGHASPSAAAAVLASSLVARPLFCDLLAQAPLNLERHASVDAVREFKLVTLDEVTQLQAALRAALPQLTEPDARDTIAVAVSLAGAFWQMATPPPEIRRLYESEPALAHAIVDVQPRVEHALEAMLLGFTSHPR